MTITHNFSESLEQSHRAADMPFWEECYAQFFPDMQAMLDHRQDGDHQRNGVDRSIILQNSKQILIDEKVRGRNKITGKIYDDIALEEWSDEERKHPGWVIKPLLCDYIAYAIAPLGKCYLLPVVQLQMAWRMRGELWKQQYPHPIRSRNNGWTTLSWGVPVAVLFKSIGECLRARFTPTEDDSPF